MAGPTIVAKFVADTKQMTQGVDSATSSAGSKIGSFASKAAVAIGGAFALNAVVDFAKGAIDAASSVNESISKIGVVFGDSGDAIVDWSKNAAESMGMSQAAALEAAGTYGNLAVSLGLPQEQAATMSQSLVGLASDMASFNNVPVDQALQALQSGLTGETEPLKKFGVNLNEAALKAKAMSMGLSDGKGPLDASAKAQASYALIMEQTTTAQGDFARTSDGLANQNKINAAKFDDMRAKIGNALLPAMTAIASFIADTLLPAFESIGNWISDHLDVVAALGIGLAAVGVAILVTLVPTFIAWAGAAFTAAAATLAAVWPFLLIGAAVAALAFLIIKNWDTIKAVTLAVWDAILGAVMWVFDWIKEHWQLVVSIIAGPIGLAAALVISHWDTIKGAALAVWDFIQMVWDKISGAIGFAVGIVRGHIEAMISLFRGVMNAASEVFSWVVGRFQAMADFIGNIVGAVAGAIGRIVDAIKGPINAILGLWNNLAFRVPEFTLPSVDLPVVGKVGGQTLGGWTIDFPNIPLLAGGGVLTSPTLFVGGEAGTEVVAPEAMLRAIVSEEAGGSYTLNLYTRTADASDVAYAFARLEMMAGVM